MSARIKDRLLWPIRRVAGSEHVAAPRGRIVWFLGGLLTLCFLTLVAYPPSLVKTIEYVGYDEMVRFLGKALAPPEAAVVDVDEYSLAKLGQWPWPRYRIAALIERASTLGARAIAVDFLFSEPDRLSLNNVGELYGRDRGITLNLSNVPDDARDNDRILAETVARYKVVLSQDLKFGEPLRDAPEPCGPSLNVVLRALSGAGETPPIPIASGTVCPVPLLADAAHVVAAANTLPDRDGKLRRMPLLMRRGEQWTPSLALGVFLAASGSNHVFLKWSAAGILELQVGETIIPTDYQGNLLLPYRSRPTDRFTHISAADLLEGRVESERLQDKIVFIGSSASGLQDMHATPVMRLCPGIDLHALAADAMLRKDFFVEPGWSRSAQVLLVILAGLFVSSLVTWAPIILVVFATSGAVITLILSSWFIFDHWGVYCSPILGSGMVLTGSALLMVVRLRREEKRKELLKKSFERYVSAQIVEQILQSSQPVNLCGERRPVTILMSDIRGFTPLSEQMAPEDLVQFLNSYFAAMIDIILASEGTLDKFMGDAVLALFGAPIQHDDDALRAVKAAVAMQETLRELNAKWVERGKPKIRVGIGISTGEVIVGNIGSAKRLEYTAIGQDVNYAQRIEDLTKQIPFDILVNATTYEQVKDYVEAEQFGPLTLKGKEAPIYVYAIKGLAD